MWEMSPMLQYHLDSLHSNEKSNFITLAEMRDKQIDEILN